MKHLRIFAESRFVPPLTLAAMVAHAALQLRSYLAVSHPVNHDVLLYLSWMLRAHEGLGWSNGFDYLAGLGIADFWSALWVDPIAVVLRLSPFGETFYWYRFSVVVLAILTTYGLGAHLANSVVGQISAIGVTIFAFLPGRFSHMNALDFSGPGFAMTMLGWTAQMFIAIRYLAGSRARRQLGWFVLGGVTTMVSAHIWQTMYLYLLAVSFVALAVCECSADENTRGIKKTMKLLAASTVSVVVHALLFTSTVPLSVFSARRSSESVTTSAEVGILDFLDRVAAKGYMSLVILVFAVVGVVVGLHDSSKSIRVLVRFWAVLMTATVLYVIGYAPLMSRGIEVGMNPEYFMQASTSFNWVVAAYGMYRSFEAVSSGRVALKAALAVTPFVVAVSIPIAWNIKNADTRARTAWPEIAQPPRVFSELSTSFAHYRFTPTARTLVIQDDTSYLSSFDELFFDFSTLRRSSKQALFNTYSGFVRPWSAEFVSSFVFDGDLRHSSITATKVSPIAIDLLGIDHVVSRRPVLVGGARRVAQRPDGVGLYVLPEKQSWFVDSYEVRRNLEEHVAALHAFDTSAASKGKTDRRAVMYESIGKIVQPTSSQVEIGREQIEVSGMTTGVSLLTLPVEFSTCNRWKSVRGETPRPVVVNGFFQGYVFTGEFEGEINRLTRGVGQIVCETRDYLRWREVNTRS